MGKGVYVAKRRISLNRIISFLIGIIVFYAVFGAWEVSAFAAPGAIRIDEPYHRYLENGDFFTTAFKPSETITANFVMMHCLKDNISPGINETFEVAITSDSAGNNPLTSAQITKDLGYNSVSCDTSMYLFDFDDVTLTGGTTYYLRTEALVGTEGSKAVFAWKGGTLFYDSGMPSLDSHQIDISGGHTFSSDGVPLVIPFQPDANGRITAKYLIIESLDDQDNDVGTETFEVAIDTDSDGNNVLTSAQITKDFTSTGSMYSFDFANVTLKTHIPHYLVLKVIEGAPVRMGAVSHLYYTEWRKDDYIKMTDPPDVDKKAHGDPENENPTCWLAAAANMLAGAGYGTGANVQARADNIYTQLVNNPDFGTNKSGVPNTAMKWWLNKSGHNPGDNPYTIVDVIKTQKDLSPWRNPDGANEITVLSLCAYIGPRQIRMYPAAVATPLPTGEIVPG
jgi:hypothetical protein